MKRGFTLVELMVAMVVASLLGIALTQMLVSDSRFVGRQEGMLNARATARAAMNVMAQELRMVGDSGLVAATATQVTVRVPFASGMSCGSSGALVYVSLMPLDSLAFATATPGGVGWRDAVGAVVIVPAKTLTVTPTANQALCLADSIRIIPGGALVTLGSVPATRAPPGGSILYLYQVVTYRFAPSVDVPGRTALWREVEGTPEEIAVPFDPSAGFGFLVGANLVPLAAPPADLSTVRGLELRLLGSSETRASTAGFETFDLTTQVAFLNRRVR